MSSDRIPGPPPNILFILVDELRYPTVFPGDIESPGQFLARFMPHVHKLWERGVKFGNYHTAANACTPSRGVIITGLYSQQNWLITTILSTPYPPAPPPKQPVLNPLYPTFGKLLRDGGYQTPYTGKWHVSVPSPNTNALEHYGFDYYSTYYDPTGDNLQGTYGDEIRGYHNDSYSAGQAVDWLLNKRPANQPWCLTVGLVNPHDREFFPAGTEFETVNRLFANSAANPNNLSPGAKYVGNGPVVPYSQNGLKSPMSYGFPVVPPNWESAATIAANKPSSQVFAREFSQLIWGGVGDEPSHNAATIAAYPGLNPTKVGVAKMPYSYWQRGLDSY